MSSSPVGTRYCVCRPQQICTPAQYIQSLMSSGHNKYGLQPFSPIYTLSITSVCRPSQICPPVQYIHYILYPALCTNIYTKYFKCLQAITNMSSSPVGTRYCVCRPQQIYPPAQYIQGIICSSQHICLLGWMTYML